MTDEAVERIARANDVRWRDRALCRGIDPETFFPFPSEDTSAAVKICRGCPVRRECLQAGLEEEHGIWGGLTPEERESVRRFRGQG